ncbi:MAG: hypothetical protein J7L95_04315, partial [Prolixibacteraceae bacterium]|nr:hypothetical protein [Prolixibacteraceae bacterium]
MFFDNKVVYDFEYNPQSLPRFFIALDSYVNGLHQFTIQAFTSSNTGSIADKMGVEGYLYETVWPVLIKHNIEPRVAIKNVQFKNGSAIINWEKYDYYGFQSYNFNKYSSIEGNKFNFVIHNPYLNGVVDTSYIEGEYAGYRVKLNNLFSSKYYNFYVAIDPPVVSLLNNGILNVEWSKSQNKKIFGSYYVTVKAPKGGKNEEFKTNLIENTSTTFLTPGFGDSYEIQVRYVPKTFTGPYLNFNSAGGRTSYSMGNTMPKFEKGMEIGSTGNVLLFNQGKFYKYSILNNLVIDSFEVADLTNSATIRISPKGEYFCYFTYNKFVLRETATWNMVNSFNVPFLNNGNLELRSVSISDKYQLVVVDHFNTLKVVDISTGTELYRKTSSPNEFIQMAVVNSEADRILYKIRIYSENENYLRLGKFNGLEISPIGETTISTSGTNYNVSQFAFIDNQVLLLKNIASYNYSWEVRNIEDFALIKSIELPKKFVPVAIDFNNLKLVLKYGYSGGYDYSY